MDRSLVQYLIDVTNSRSIEDLWDKHCRKMREYGFDKLLYGFTHFSTPKGFGNPDDFIVLTNHSNDYIEKFVKTGLFLNAPLVKWAVENEGWTSWSIVQERIERGEICEKGLDVLKFNQEYGVTAGYTISFKAMSQRSRGAIALTAGENISQDKIDEVWDEHGNDIVLLNNVIHLKILSLPYTTMSGRRLTKRQREALEWVGDGKTTQDIAILMGLTPATVEKHLRLARETMGVETTAQAVLKAAFQNQMFTIGLDDA